MNRLMIIGNLVRDPELRTTPVGKSVCNFTVAVNKRGKKDEADYFRVNAWNQLGESCAKYLSKGRKVAVEGSVSLSVYESNGKTGASLEVVASDVEFLSPREQDASGMQRVEPEDNPFERDLPF